MDILKGEPFLVSFDRLNFLKDYEEEHRDVDLNPEILLGTNRKLGDDETVLTTDRTVSVIIVVFNMLYTARHRILCVRTVSERSVTSRGLDCNRAYWTSCVYQNILCGAAAEPRSRRYAPPWTFPNRRFFMHRFSCRLHHYTLSLNPYFFDFRSL